MNTGVIILIGVLILAVAVLCAMYAKLARQSKINAADLAEKEALMKKYQTEDIGDYILVFWG